MTAVDQHFTWAQLWDECSQRLADRDKARRLVEHLSGRTGTGWMMTDQSSAPLDAADRAGELLKRIAIGEPLQYVLQSWSFRELDLHVDRRVLIPRPETEMVVEAALRILQPVESPLVADLGTGSGAIALSIALEHPGARVCATDLSNDALDVAADNAAELDFETQDHITFYEGSWFDALPPELHKRFDLLISNPPYIGEHEAGTVEEIVADWEPHLALFSGPDGLDAIDHLVTNALTWLKPAGSLVVELSPQQAERVAELARTCGFDRVAIGKDLTGRDRFLVAAAPA